MMVNHRGERQAAGVVEPEMVCVPAGPFVMGSGEAQVEALARHSQQAARWLAKGYFRREQPQHTVSLPDFSIARYPVTAGAFRAFVAAGGCEQQRHWTAAGWHWRQVQNRTSPAFWDETWAGDGQLPVVGVSWYEALAYCRWLAEVTGRGYRLPSEAEWEKAARGPEGRIYPWGDHFEPGRCNTRAAGPGHTLPVGSHSPGDESAYGCGEMAGNTSEWTLSLFQPYPYDAGDGREAAEGEGLRVIRGGSWFKPALRARAAARGMNDPFFVDHDVGFRCALTDQVSNNI